MRAVDLSFGAYEGLPTDRTDARDKTGLTNDFGFRRKQTARKRERLIVGQSGLVFWAERFWHRVVTGGKVRKSIADGGRSCQDRQSGHRKKVLGQTS